MKKIAFVLSLVIALFSFALCGCNSKYEKFTDYSFDSFDTVTSIVGFEKDKDTFDKNCELIKSELNRYHKLYTIYTKYEGINNLCIINEQKKDIKAPKEIIDLLDFSAYMYELTKGKVNIAMGSVLSIWHNYRTEGLEHPEKAEIPSFSVLKDASKHTDIKDIKIDSKKGTVSLSNDKMSLDVGAVAKGYAVEKVAQLMEDKGIRGYILNVGGNVRIVGNRPDKEKWNVGIENPDTDNEEKPYIANLELDGGMSLVTSGSYQRFYNVEGKNYHHIIDPKTLMPAEYFVSVSVLCKDSGKADALSTALFCMPYKDGLEIIKNSDDTEAMWVLPDGTIRYSQNFRDFFK